MNSFSGPIDDRGAIVSLQVGLKTAVVRRLRSMGVAIAQPVDCQALLDSGSDATCVDPTILAPLRAAALTDYTIVLTNAPALGGLGYAVEYAVSLRIVHPDGDSKRDLFRGDHPIVEKQLAALGYEALIGRDVLARCILILDGPSQSFTLAY